MKRLFIACLVITIASFCAVKGTWAAGEFSKPILVGGDSPSPNKDPQTVTQATSLKAIVHPYAQPGDLNFDPAVIDGKIQPDGGLDPIFVDDIVMTPGFEAGKTPDPNGPMFDHPTPRFGTLDQVIGVGLEDFIVQTLVFNWHFEYELEPAKNIRSHRMALGDIRKENPLGEFEALFNKTPLEEFLIGGSDTALIGNANEDTPYIADKYPATIVAPTSPQSIMDFQWCVFNLWPSRTPSNNPCWQLPMELGDKKYSSVFLYDVANLGNNGLASVSYDPLNVYNKKIIVHLNGAPFGVGYKLLFSYYSPITLFRKVEDPNDVRFRFSGYSSIEFPKIVCDVTSCKLDPNLWKFLPTNWIVPFATNGIPIEDIDLNGKSSPPGDPADTDLAVTYQTTFYDLNMPVPDPFGRPGVYGDGFHHTYRELFGTCVGGPCNATFKPLTKDVFPDDVVSLVLFKWQTEKWAVGGDHQPYVNVNASHIFDDKSWAFVGPGVYDTAVLTDHDQDPLIRKQHLLVPSTADDPSDPNNGVIYMIDPDSDKKIWFHHIMSKDATGFTIYNPVPPGQDPPKCLERDDYYDSPIIVPDYVPVQKPADGYVPYQIRTDDLDGDECGDFIITWRGKNTIQDPLYPTHARFDDGTGRMFSDRVTIVIRSWDGAKCDMFLPQDYPAGQYPNNFPTHIKVVDQTNPDPQAVVASAAIGDFDSDGRNDIVAGNFKSEQETAYAYAYWGGSAIPFDTVNVERFRTGFREGAGIDWGTSMIEADHTTFGPDVLMQINGMPLMLPEIECPDYTPASTDPTVGSLFETYVSIANNLLTMWVNKFGPPLNIPLGSNPGILGHVDPFNGALPFVDVQTQKNPVPKRCAEKRICTYGGVTKLPFFEDDPCCVDPCGMNKKDWVEKCASYVYAYGKIGRSCPLLEYVYQWGDPMQADCGPQVWAENQMPSMKLLNRALAMDDDRGGGDDSGETDFASAWKPDSVLDESSGAIADRKNLVLAQALSQVGEKEEEEAGRATISTIETKKVRDPNPLANINVPFRGLFGYGIREMGQGSAEAEQMARLIETSADIEMLERKLNEQFPNLIIGAPQSIDYLFLQPIAALLVASTAGVNGEIKLDVGGKGQRNVGSISGGSVTGACSLVAPDVIASDSEAISWNKIREKLSAFATWIWDLLVPSAEAAVCGNGVIEPGEECDVGGLSDAAAWAQVLAVCPPPPSTVYVLDDCDMNDCRCDFKILTSEPPDIKKSTVQKVPDDLLKLQKNCGNGIIDSGEDCDGAQICQPVGPLMACGVGPPTPAICAGQGSATPCKWVCTSCSDGCLDPAEQCDKTSDTPNHGCPQGKVCTDSCNCITQLQQVPAEMLKVQPTCGNGIIEPGEECDKTLDVPNHGCPQGKVCTDTCNCITQLQQVPAEMIKVQPTCGNGSIDSGEACDPNSIQRNHGCAAGSVCSQECKCLRKYEKKKVKSIKQQSSRNDHEAGNSIFATFATWVWDLLVPSAEAATCGDGIQESSEDCEAPFICQAVGPLGCAGMAPIKMLCAGPGSATPCKWVCPGCGDGCLYPGKQCDLTADAPNYGCPWGKTCSPTCQCLSTMAPLCGNGVQNGTEECDPPGKLCPAGQYCTGNCVCAPGMAIDAVKFPQGYIPPGNRETTAVVRKGPPKCNYDGTKDAWEECDVAGLSDAAAEAQVLAVCPPPPSTDYELDDCDMNDCTCDYKVLPCQQKPGVECTKYSDCGADEICDINCECVPPPGPGPGPGEILTTAYNDCYIHADSFSGDAEAALYKKLNDAVREVTGRTDDLFVEPEQRVIVLCKVGAASAPGIDAADLSLSLSGTPLPDSADNLRPYMVVQTSGSEFIDSGTLVYKSFELVEEPMRILPMEAVDPATQQIKAVVLPSSSLQGVSPMSTSSVMVSGGVMQVNNMIEHRVYNVLPGQEFTIMMGGSAQKVMVAQAQIPDDSGYGIHEFRFITPPDCASWTGTAGYEYCPNIEDRQFDWEMVKQALEENKAAMSGPPTSAIYSHLPWELNLNYNFGLVQEVYSKAGDPVPEPVELPFAYLAGQPTMMGKGGGCSCNMSSGGQGMRAILPYLLWLIIPTAGIAIGRARRRR